MSIQSDHFDRERARTRSGRSLKDIAASGDMLLLRSLFRQIVRRGAVTIIASDGRAHHIGSGIHSVAIRIADTAVIARLPLNPDSALGEAYMDGALSTDDGDVYDFLDLCFANLGWSRGHAWKRVRADERFCRMWEFYLAGCKAAFRHGGLVNFQVQLSRRVDTVPLTRDYIFAWERSHADDVPDRYGVEHRANATAAVEVQ